MFKGTERRRQSLNVVSRGLVAGKGRFYQVEPAALRGPAEAELSAEAKARSSRSRDDSERSLPERELQQIELELQQMELELQNAEMRLARRRWIRVCRSSTAASSGAMVAGSGPGADQTERPSSTLKN